MAVFDTVALSAERAKKVAAEMALDQALKYLSRDPEQNLPRILDFAEKVAPDEGQKEHQGAESPCGGDRRSWLKLDVWLRIHVC